MEKLALLLLLISFSPNVIFEKKMAENIFEIKHSEFGTEEFLINSPEYNLYKAEDGFWEFVIAFNTSKSLKRAKELEDVIDAKPNFEATAILSPNDLKLEIGKTIIQKQGYDYERDEHLSNIYYFEHNSVENLEIKIIDVQEHWIIIDAKANAVINGSNGNEPDADLFIHRTKFQLNKELERDIM
jgi:hypothetical protein